MRRADRILRLRQSFRMRPEHHRAGLGRAIGVGHRGLREGAMRRLHQACAHRRRAHADELDAREVGLRQRVGLAQHHGDHRRHGGEPGRPVLADRLDIGARLEARQQHDGGVRRAGELGERQRVHVIERRRDQVAMAVEPGRQPRLDHPDVALVREHDALGRAGRARGVEKHRRLVRLGGHRLEHAGIEEMIEAARPAVAEADLRQISRTVLAAREIAEHQPRAGVPDDEIDGLARKAIVHRHRHQARAHDAEVGGEIFGAVGRRMAMRSPR